MDAFSSRFILPAVRSISRLRTPPAIHFRQHCAAPRLIFLLIRQLENNEMRFRCVAETESRAELFGVKSIPRSVRPKCNWRVDECTAGPAEWCKFIAFCVTQITWTRLSLQPLYRLTAVRRICRKQFAFGSNDRQRFSGRDMILSTILSIPFSARSGDLRASGMIKQNPMNENIFREEFWRLSEQRKSRFEMLSVWPLNSNDLLGEIRR